MIYSVEHEKCICTTPINYVYTLKNKINGNTLTPIGSVCIHKFGNTELSFYINHMDKKIYVEKYSEKYTFEEAFKLGYLGTDMINTKCGKLYNKFINLKQNKAFLDEAFETLGNTVQSTGKYKGLTYKLIIKDKQYINWLQLNQSYNSRFRGLLNYYIFTINNKVFF